MTWLCVSLPGLSSTGFIRTSGSIPAACACMARARPISAPLAVTNEFSDIFCALNGATRTPRRASARHRPAVSTLFPTSDAVPATSNAPLSVIAMTLSMCPARDLGRAQWDLRRR